MRIRLRSTILALTGLLALGGVAGCERQGSSGTPGTEIEREGESNLEGDPMGEADVDEPAGGDSG
jgi:hypothetical protein